MQPRQYDRKKKGKKQKFRERTNQISGGNRTGTNEETTPHDEGGATHKSNQNTFPL